MRPSPSFSGVQARWKARRVKGVVAAKARRTSSPFPGPKAPGGQASPDGEDEGGHQVASARLHLGGVGRLHLLPLKVPEGLPVGAPVLQHPGVKLAQDLFLRSFPRLVACEAPGGGFPEEDQGHLVQEVRKPLGRGGVRLLGEAPQGPLHPGAEEEGEAQAAHAGPGPFLPGPAQPPDHEEGHQGEAEEDEDRRRP